MPAKEIKELRKAGKLEDALAMAKTELNADPNNIWPKRNISWVYYEYIKRNSEITHFSDFLQYLNELVALQLPADEKMVFDNVAWQVGKMIFALVKQQSPDLSKIYDVLNLVKQFHFTKPSGAYTFLLKAFHKALKDTPDYNEFIDWWGFENLQPVDHEKEKLPDGKEVMSLAEQVYIAYAKHLLPKVSFHGEVLFEKEKTENFLPVLDKIIETHPHFQYPPYYKAKLILALGEGDMLSAILPFAKKKRNEFWVWEVLSEAFPNDEEKQLACHCKALTCKTSDDFLIKIRQKMAQWFVDQQLWNEAKTEIELIVQTREANGWKLPPIVETWKAQPWYAEAKSKKSNDDFYNRYLPIAEAILFSDVPEEAVIIEFVNTERSIANFIATDEKFGFFKFDRFFKRLNIGDTLKVRFNGGSKEGIFQLLTAKKIEDRELKQRFVKDIAGVVRIADGRSFGFVDDIFVHPTFVKRFNLENHQEVTGTAIRSYNTDKKQWGWKVFEILT